MKQREAAVREADELREKVKHLEGQIEELNAHTEELKNKRKATLASEKGLPGNHGQPWTKAELACLREGHYAGLTVQGLMKEYGRSKGGITSALRKAGVPFNCVRWAPGTAPVIRRGIR